MEKAEAKSMKLSQLSLQQLDRFKAQLNEVSDYVCVPPAHAQKTAHKYSN